MGINQVWYKGTRIKYSSELRKHENENIKNIEKELNSLEALYASIDNTDLNIETKLLTLKNERKSYVEKKTEGAVIRSKAKWIHEAERNTRFFFNLEKRNYINKSM